MSSTSSPPPHVPEPAVEQSSVRVGDVSADLTAGPESSHLVSPPATGTTRQPHPHRTRQIVSIVLILAGLALLIITLRAQDLGLAPTEGASWTQVTTGVVGTILLVTGLALIVQAFEDSDEPPAKA